MVTAAGELVIIMGGGLQGFVQAPWQCSPSAPSRASSPANVPIADDRFGL
jgi:hypothetical protein